MSHRKTTKTFSLAAGPGSPSSTRTGLTSGGMVSRLKINGVPVPGDWSFSIDHDAFSAPSYDLTVNDRRTTTFDYEQVREIYQDDPVALAIIDRMARLEWEYSLISDLTIKEFHRIADLPAKIAENIPEGALFPEKYKNQAKSLFEAIRGESTYEDPLSVRRVPVPADESG